MDQRHRLSRTRSLLCACLAATLVSFCGCADMMPDSETWEKWSPSNIWYRMQPDQLGRLNEQNSGMTSEAYYSISDYPERDRSVVIKPIENTAPAAQH